MDFTEKAEKFVRDYLDIQGVKIDSKRWSDGQVNNIEFLLTGENEPLMKAAAALCQASHGKLEAEALKGQGFIKEPFVSSTRSYERFARFLNDNLQLINTPYLGIQGDAGYMMDLGPRRRIFISVSYDHP